MIKVEIKNDDFLLGVIEIEKLDDSTRSHGNYSIRFGFTTGESEVAYQRSISYFPRLNYNIMALVLQALNTLGEKELYLDGDPDTPRPPRNARLSRYLARRQR